MSVAIDSHSGKTLPKPISQKFGSVIPKVKCVNLALQGGSAHGAFTWGVLDRLMEDPRIEIEGVSATSAGAMNAAVMAHGLTTGGRKGAREALEEFWQGVARVSAPSGALQLFEVVSRFLSPYQLNPFNYNPLRQLILRCIDFERLRQGSAIKLFLSATNVRTGKIKVFTDKEITADCVLASACLPFLYQAVEIKGEHYWDGGHMGNPALFPLIYSCQSRDVLIVHVNPIERPDKPTNACEIMNRVNEISFNSSLMREMRAVAFVTKLIDDGKLSQGDAKRVLIHSVCADDVMRGLGAASKLNADRGFLRQLHALGRERAQAWIDRHFDALVRGPRSTFALPIFEKRDRPSLCVTAKLACSCLLRVRLGSRSAATAFPLYCQQQTLASGGMSATCLATGNCALSRAHQRPLRLTT